MASSLEGVPDYAFLGYGEGQAFLCALFGHRFGRGRACKRRGCKGHLDNVEAWRKGA